MPDNCSRSVVSNYVVFTQWLFPVEEFNIRGFLQLVQWQESGIIYHPFLLRYFGEDAADTVSYFSLVSHDLLVGLFFLQELWMLQQKYPFSTL